LNVLVFAQKAGYSYRYMLASVKSQDKNKGNGRSDSPYKNKANGRSHRPFALF
jgi:hypothetical protein